MPYSKELDTTIYIDILAILFVAGINKFNYKKLEKTLQQLKVNPKYQELLQNIPADTSLYLPYLEKFHYISKKDNELNSYRITFNEQTIIPIINKCYNRNDYHEILDIVKNYLKEIPVKKEEIKPNIISANKTYPIETGDEVLLAIFCALSYNGINTFEEELFESSTHYNLEDQEFFYDQISSYLQRKIKKEDLNIIIQKYLNTPISKRDYGDIKIPNVIERVNGRGRSFLIHLTKEQVKSILSQINPTDLKVIDTLYINKYLEELKKKENLHLS